MSNPFDEAIDAVIAPPAAKARTTANRATVAIAEQDVLSNDDTEAEAAERVAALQAQVDAIKDGIYFGLPDVVYHAVPRLSASGLQKLCVSPATFWRHSWLDPERPELDEEQTKAQVLGKAYHTARLEPQLFDAIYCRQPDKADYPRGTLFTGKDMEKALAALNLPKSGSVGEQADRLVANGYEGVIWHIELARWETERRGRLPIAAKFYDQIVTDMERIRGNEEIAALLSNGEAEVSIFWTDQHGLKMKARVDYLAAAHWADFKTFDNSKGKELEQALAEAVRYNRYHVQAVTYRDAVEAIRTGGLQIMGEASDAQRTLVAAIQIKPGELACWYIFQEKGGIPNLLGYEFPFHHIDAHRLAEAEALAKNPVQFEQAIKHQRKDTGLHRRAQMDVLRAKQAFVLHCESYEPGQPWFPLKPTGAFGDELFNDYWLKGAA